MSVGEGEALGPAWLGTGQEPSSLIPSQFLQGLEPQEGEAVPGFPGLLEAHLVDCKVGVGSSRYLERRR